MLDQIYFHLCVELIHFNGLPPPSINGDEEVSRFSLRRQQDGNEEVWGRQLDCCSKGNHVCRSKGQKHYI